MSELIEDVSLRDKEHVFEDRKEAGRLLAERLRAYEGSESAVLAIPSGGVPVASEIAGALKLPLDLIIVRKIQIPFNPEAGFGALSPDGEVIFNERLLKQLALTDREIQMQVDKTLSVIRQRNELFRGGKPEPSVGGRSVIIVDDGLASGYTMLSAIRFMKKSRPLKIVVAVPTASKNTADFILPETDELHCLNVRSGFRFAVADAYRRWYDLTDKEVLDIIKQSKE